MEKDYTQAFEWYQKAVKKGDAEPQYYLGRMYELGWAVDKDYTQALKLYQQAAEKGYAEAQYKLGLILDHDLFGLRKNMQEARVWYQKAAEQGHEMAQHNLHLMNQAQPRVNQDNP